MSPSNVLTVNDCSFDELSRLLEKFTLKLTLTKANEKIPGSYWGDSEAGLIAQSVYVREDTPVHSLLHESCHFICMDQQRREQLDTDAEGDYDEENAVCYLQILLAGELLEMGRTRMMQDMDRWGYTFRLGSAKRWFEEDACDARQWLVKEQLIDQNETALYRLRA